MLKTNTNKAMIKNSIYIIFINFIIISSFSSCNKGKDVNVDLIYTYEAVDKTLYNEIVAMDSIFWQAYNNCDMGTQESIFSEDLEFYHDLNGLRTSKEVRREAIKTKICGKITRVLVEGSIEVYPIKNFGAVQFGLHKFHKKQEPDNASKPSRFVFIWKNDDGNWKITRVISLH